MEELFRPLQPGDTVLVYCDPVTRQDIEGPCILTKKVPCRPGREREYWWCRFPNDPNEYARFVSPWDRIIDIQIWVESKGAYVSSCPDDTVLETGEGVDDGD